jgi:molecular chaperone GrpE
MIPILDNFILAEKSIPGKEKNKGNVKGLLLIEKQLKDSLKALGLEEIESINQKFNPNMHEIIEEVEGKEPGIITEEVQKGYSFQGKVIRTSKVKVGKY